MAGQAQQLAVVVNLHPLDIQLERSAGRAGGRCFTRRYAFENGLDPRGDFPGAKGFDHVIVGTDFQTDHTIDFLAARGEKNHRHLGKPPQALAGFEATDIRQADIENQQVRRTALLFGQGLLGQAQPGGGEAFALQGEDQGVGDRGFVFDNQNMRHGRPARSNSAGSLGQPADSVKIGRSRRTSCALSALRRPGLNPA